MRNVTRRAVCSLGWLALAASFSLSRGMEEEYAARKTATTRKNTMKIETNHLSAEISVTPRITKLDDLVVTVKVRNEGAAPIIFNARYLESPALMLRIEDSQGNRVATGPPPTPADDDGKTGRLRLAPGQTISHSYPGGLIFGNPQLPGKYKVRFTYWNGARFRDEWAGTLETPGVAFEIL